MIEQTAIEYTPDQYFQLIKSKRQSVTDKDLQRIYDNCLELLGKFIKTRQVKAARKLIFHIECLEKEHLIVKSGINTFIYRDDIEEYIDNIAKDVVKIIELENYEREIPDEICGVVEQFRDVFNHFYVLFTDYTGKVERQVEQERRSTDPILFGTFQDDKTQTVVDRFYYLGDWEDEFCDLTLDKMLGEIKEATERNASYKIASPNNLTELKAQLSELAPVNDSDSLFRVTPSQKSFGFFSKIRTFLDKP